MDGSEKPLTYADFIRRGVPLFMVENAFGKLAVSDRSAVQSAEVYVKYEGYLKKGLEQIERMRKLEAKKLPADINYLEISGLRLEAREKLEHIRPASLGQASRIPGVNPADIAVLILYLK